MRPGGKRLEGAAVIEFLLIVAVIVAVAAVGFLAYCWGIAWWLTRFPD